MSKGGFVGGNNFQDWTPVVIGRRQSKPTGTKEQQANKARQAGENVESEKKYNAGTNKQSQAACYARKLADDTENFKHKQVSTDVKRCIQQGRQAKGWSQKDLAQQINEKPQVIGEYETGKAIPNGTVLGKMEKALGIKLRGKEGLGEPLQAPAKKAPAKAPGKK
eukprot:NODE_5646_length_685_cov_117.844086_g5623_i0.p1 GENE.NODE_5646_length_685_cov_117.844086_g5623_i0~~NODE_5646_length_685_cov_117.844086_g5623_i0.p1  ORF type:complete len:188 (+),score=46.60 NODE_5646_length_685_cov_117.844086_g5623_i0:71-565(+)